MPTSGRERKEGWVGVVEKEEEGKAGGEKERDDGKGKGLEMKGRRNQKHLSFPPFPSGERSSHSHAKSRRRTKED